MRPLATRPRRLVLGIAVLSAAALGSVTAAAAPASHATDSGSHGTVVSGKTVVKQKGQGGKEFGSGKGVPFAVEYTPTSHAPGDLNAANTRFAACMRAQGQSVFPDFHASKGSDGGVMLRVHINGKGGPGLDPTSSGYKKAIGACGPILKKTGITFPNPGNLPAPPSQPAPGKGEGGITRHAEGGKSGKPGDPGKVTSELPSLTRAFENS
ncbi:hypothetical protein [Streptomyces sp. MBT53]|uniref:hypothetical protein n=1 Tax=Streptomyces sp. MBT53 TaxID=1488384 RepID=UPI001913E76C|nr:hypothetical protein [Streptomyces sp. MBT53]MBK6017638.1 hypothetical protein [Streptomyces sp. MBT53]